MTFGISEPDRLGLGRKLLRLNWLLIVLIPAIAGIGFAMLYSVADASFTPWAKPQMTRFAVGFALMLIVAMIDIRRWRSLAYPIYAGTFALLVAVEFVGVAGMGAQRWVDLGAIKLQPSEIMKIALVLGLARYYHGLSPERARKVIWALPAIAMIAAPTVLVLKQPDLGTAALLAAGGAIVMFLAGLAAWFFLFAAFAAGGAIYLVFASRGTEWQILKDYQYRRIEVFLNPEIDPLGASYHITQSKIAFGSGGVFGKGYLQGPQSHLNFLPEKHTDFVFTTFAEEFGLIGSLGLLALYFLVIAACLISILRIRHRFGRLLASGVSANFFLYFAINIAMVMGLAPVVGAPLPLISYGGTSMLALLFGFGLLLSAQCHRDVEMEKRRRG